MGTPLYRGGFADILEGEYEGRKVAVKLLRVHPTLSNIDRIKEVSDRCRCIIRINELTTGHRVFARRSLYGNLFAIKMCRLYWE